MAVNPFRRQLYNELYQSNELVRAFGGSLPGGRMSLPEMDDWTLGIKRRNRFYIPLGFRNFQPANAKAPMDLLADVHTVLVVDDSGSMEGRNWLDVRNLLGEIAPLLARYAAPNPAQYKSMDMDRYRREKLSTTHSAGFDMHFLNYLNPVQGLRTPAEVFQIFNRVQPSGGTPTGNRINDLFDAYMSTLRFDRNMKPANLVILTDGADNGWPEELLDLAIEEHASHVVQRGHPAHQLGVEFLQVGNDWAAADHLDELEEKVDGHHRNLNCDVVGVTHMNTFTEGLTPDVLARIMVQGIEAREQGYHRDFRAREQQAAQMRRQRYGYAY